MDKPKEEKLSLDERKYRDEFNEQAMALDFMENNEASDDEYGEELE